MKPITFLNIILIKIPTQIKTMEKTTMNEDVSPIKNSDFPLSC